MVLAFVRFGSFVVPPGRVCNISVNDEGWICCMASLLMTEALLRPVTSSAVTTTSCRVNIRSMLSSSACWALSKRTESGCIPHTAGAVNPMISISRKLLFTLQNYNIFLNPASQIQQIPTIGDFAFRACTGAIFFVILHPQMSK